MNIFIRNLHNLFILDAFKIKYRDMFKLKSYLFTDGICVCQSLTVIIITVGVEDRT